MREDNVNSRQLFDELLPWYVNYTLEPAQRDWVERYIETYTDAAAELKSAIRFCAKLREEVEASMPANNAGLKRLMARIHEAPLGRRQRSGVGGHETGWFRRLWEGFHFTPTFAAVATVMIAQTAVIGMLVMKKSEQTPSAEDYSTYRSVGEAKKTGPVLKVSIKPDAREQDIRLLLASIGGKLVGGPGQLGDYYVQVSPLTLNDAKETLKHSDLIDMVEIVSTLPED